MSYRSKTQERDYSGFVQPNISEIGAMVIKAPKGKKTPVLCTSEEDILREFGAPSSSYPDIFEAIAFCSVAPCYISAPYHSDALFGGMDVQISGVAGFGTGRNIDTFNFDAFPDVSHAFFATSPYVDNLVGKITYISGKKFKLDLYKSSSVGNELLNSYVYSLNIEKDAFGQSLYIMDVFDNNYYVIPKVNPNFTGTAYNLSGLTANFSGGTRGSEIDSADVLAGWDNFKYANKYPVRIMMDTRGDSAVTVNNLIQTYQPYAQGICAIPMGKDASEAVTFRQGLGIDSDDIGFYTNWAKIKDNYNNSFAWISNIGSVGKKFAKMADIFDSGSPAGIDENGHGGQLSDWEVIEVEYDYTDSDFNSELELLDDAQINPIIKDINYGLMIYGDKTSQVTLSDTSYVGTRRVYKYIMKNIAEQVLRLQEFKNNDIPHRRTAKVKTEAILRPVRREGGISDFRVVCDASNNTADVLNQRQFLLDVYVIAMANSQEVKLRFTRMPQGTIDINLSVVS